MKTIHNINKWSFIITLVLYITIIGGLLAQIALGAIQIVLGIIILFHWKKLNIKTKRHLLLYWFIVLMYGLLWATDTFNTWKTSSMVLDPYILFICITPMLIASYSVYITHQSKTIIYELKPSYL
ncbi:hypothetical protein SAMN04487910_3873 [Aquimarina amphilecti]|uniref:Uncharacterized protein n=1 Tax=Aquimarina amphilecti TaxID=1038014 RepID=A0A1H7UTX2_AQUAM|nr:hypothetical protein [Aquimarina amphilecti]SEM00294.1 hypothetical protein SAMN04487910_3873 [Aquimarina amphilecti]